MTTPGPVRWCATRWSAPGTSTSAWRRRTPPGPSRGPSASVPTSACSTSTCPGTASPPPPRSAGLCPDTSVVMLTVSRQDEDLFDALRAGASGYLLKGMDEATIGDALQRVLAGEATLPGTLVARLVDEFRDREHRRVAVPEGQAARLTGREWDVLELMRKGSAPPRSRSACSSRRPRSAATSRPFCASSACRPGKPPSGCSTARPLRSGSCGRGSVANGGLRRRS